MDHLLRLTPREFEETVASYLRSRGFQDVQRIGGAGDLGVDIQCQDEYGRLVAVQCKRYQRGAKIGSPEIQHFYGMVVRRNAARGIFVTTSDYTQPARRLAHETDIELIDGAQIGVYFAELERQKREAELARQREAAREAELERQRFVARQLEQQREETRRREEQRAASPAYEPEAHEGDEAAVPILALAPTRGTSTRKNVADGILALASFTGWIVSIVGAVQLRTQQGRVFWFFSAVVGSFVLYALLSDIVLFLLRRDKKALLGDVALTILWLLTFATVGIATLLWEDGSVFTWLAIAFAGLMIVLAGIFSEKMDTSLENRSAAMRLIDHALMFMALTAFIVSALMFLDRF